MARRKENRLIPLDISRSMKPGMYPDGNGLYLRVGPNGAKAWVLRFRFGGKRHDMGLSAYPLFSLKEAREKARVCRRELAEGINPMEARRTVVSERRAEAAKMVTFEDCAKAYIAAHSLSWKNAKHEWQWRQTLEAHVYPILGRLPVTSIDTPLIMRVLNAPTSEDKKSVWHGMPETAGRVRGRIEAVLNWATANGFRAGDNPARWRGHLDKLLPAKEKIAKVKHQAAMPYADVPKFMADLLSNSSLSATALTFTIFTAARTSEVINARWDEISLKDRVWTIPGERMKAGREHRVPFSDEAAALLRSLPGGEGEAFLFLNSRTWKPLSNMAMLELMKDMRPGLTVHGFRSSFRDWAGEQTSFPREIAEAALAHSFKSKTEASYQRGDPRRQSDGKTRADFEALRRHPTRLPGINLPMNARSKLDRMWFPHANWPPSQPAS
jgi:integrase